jgi:hypothetical protein
LFGSVDGNASGRPPHFQDESGVYFFRFKNELILWQVELTRQSEMAKPQNFSGFAAFNLEFCF